MFLFSKETEQLDGQYSPIVTRVYKCTDLECQTKTDKSIAQMVKRREDQETARVARLENAKKNRMK